MNKKRHQVLLLAWSMLVLCMLLAFGGASGLAGTEAAPTGPPGSTPGPTSSGEGQCAELERPPALDPGEEDAIRSAAQRRLDEYHLKEGYASRLAIVALWGEADFAAADCARQLGPGTPGGSDGVLLVLTKDHGTWHAALPGDAEYAQWLDLIPERYVAPATREEMRQLNLVEPDLIDPSEGIYRLPYPDGASVYITQDSDQHGGPIDMWSANGTVVAPADGWIDGFYDGHWECCCNSQCGPCNNWIKLRHPNGEYSEFLHVAQDSVQVSVGQWVTAGTVLATHSDIGWSCGGGRLETGCGAYHGETHCGVHVHFAVRSPGGAFRKPRICDGQGGWYYPEYGHTYTAVDCGETCCGCLPAECCAKGSWEYACSAGTGTAHAPTATVGIRTAQVWDIAAAEVAGTQVLTGTWLVPAGRVSRIPEPTLNSAPGPAIASRDQMTGSHAVAMVLSPAAAGQGLEPATVTEAMAAGPADQPTAPLIERSQAPSRSPDWTGSSVTNGAVPRGLSPDPPSSPNYRLPRTVLAAGGGNKAWAAVQMQGTSGQNTGVRLLHSEKYQIVSGFWGAGYNRPIPVHRMHLPIVLRYGETP